MTTNTLALKTTTSQQLSDALAHLGFQKRVTPQFTAYRNASFDALIVLPQETLGDQVRPLHLTAARATIIGKGIATAEEFDRLLRQAGRKAAAQDITSAPSAGLSEKTAGAKKRTKKLATPTAFAASAAETS